MENEQNVSPEIAGVISSLPQAGDEPQKERKAAPVKRRRKKRTAKRATATRESSMPNIPSTDDEPRSKMFLTTVANLALLVAVLMIVFAAHKAVQNRQQQATDNTLPVVAQKPQATEQTVQKAEPAKPEIIDQKQEEQPAKPVKPAQVAKPAKRLNPYSNDPYTDSGPLDLDRRGNSPVAPELPRARSTAVTDSRNPWNGGGQMDLDSETSRQQYKKALSLAE